MPNRDWKKTNEAGHIQANNVSLKTKIKALSEQRGETENETTLAVLEAGIVALTSAERPAKEQS